MSLESRKDLLESRASQPNKFETRRQQLAGAALATLGELGYANTSLRDIAAKSGSSLGTLHYYFANKEDLINYCVRRYKRNFIDEVNEVINSCTDLKSLIKRFVASFVKTVSSDSESHSLWYDIRSQAMFNEAFRPLSTEIDQSLLEMITRLTDRGQVFTGKPLTLSPACAYWAMDGMFQHFLLLHLEAVKNTDAEFESRLTEFLEALFASNK